MLVTFIVNAVRDDKSNAYNILLVAYSTKLIFFRKRRPFRDQETELLKKRNDLNLPESLNFCRNKLHLCSLKKS